MIQATPQERLALAVVGLLLAAGLAARMVGGGAAAAWRLEPGAAAEQGSGLSELRQEVGRRVGAARERSRPLAEGERLDPNTATAADLERLPRVGPALAARIVEHRQANGPFRTTGDLQAVRGVGPAMIGNLATHLSLAAGAPTARRPAARTAAERRGRDSAPQVGGSRAGGVADLPRSPGSRSLSERGGRTAGAAAANKRGGGAAAAVRIDVNRASAKELQALPGVGPVLAERIIEWRARSGPFRRAADLEQVPGIGPVLRAKIAPRLALQP